MADAVFKWAPGGDSARRHLKFQGEYLHREESGDLTFDLENSALTDAYRSTQSGWYLQGVFQFRPRWRAGLRYDSLDSGNPRIALVTIKLPGDQPLPSAHQHAGAIEEAVRERCPGLADVIVHTEPMGAGAT